MVGGVVVAVVVVAVVVGGVVAVAVVGGVGDGDVVVDCVVVLDVARRQRDAAFCTFSFVVRSRSYCFAISSAP